MDWGSLFVNNNDVVVMSVASVTSVASYFLQVFASIRTAISGKITVYKSCCRNIVRELSWWDAIVVMLG